MCKINNNSFSGNIGNVNTAGAPADVGNVISGIDGVVYTTNFAGGQTYIFP